MLLRNRPPAIDPSPAPAVEGLEHVPASSVAVLRWLNANRVDYVLVGAVARAIRGESSPTGPVAIVPAPYGRNLDRLSRALWAAHARLRIDSGRLANEAAGSGACAGTAPVKLSAEKLVRAERWTLRCGDYDIDIEGRPEGVPRYQELLYEATRTEVAPEVSAEVAAPEDIEHYDHVRRTGSAPEMRVSRAVPSASPSLSQLPR